VEKCLLWQDASGWIALAALSARLVRKQKVVVSKDQDKFASAHDLRRAFGTRWSLRVTPVVLQQLMRHASVETTLKYYVEQNADMLGAKLWELDTEHRNRIESTTQ
jgi:integrase